MKQPAFDHNRRRWDTYRHFYVDEGPFTQFETGELMLRGGKLEPHERHFYPQFNLEITTTADASCPILCEPLEHDPVPKAQLNQDGQQYLVLDHDTKLAWRVNDYSYWHPKKDKGDNVPEHLRNASLYWLQRGARHPLGGQDIVISTPDKELRRQIDTKLMSDLSTACQALVRMEAVPRRSRWDNTKCDVKRDWIGKSADEVLFEMTEDMKSAAGSNGFAYPRCESTIACLTF